MENISKYFELEFDGVTGKALIHKDEVEKIQNEIDRLRQQNAELVEALKYSLEAIECVASFGKTKPVIERIRAALAKYDQTAIAIPRHDGSQDVFASKEAAALQMIFEADESDKASGGEMWYAEVVADAIEKARQFLNPPDPDHTKATIL